MIAVYYRCFKRYLAIVFQYYVIPAALMLFLIPFYYGAGSEPSCSAEGLTGSGTGHRAIHVEHKTQYNETVYSIGETPCRISLTVYHSGINKGVIRHRAVCSEPISIQGTLIGQLLPRVLRDFGNDAFHTLSWGRLCPAGVKKAGEMSMRLVLAAKKSYLWDAEKGRPGAGHDVAPCAPAVRQPS